MARGQKALDAGTPVLMTRLTILPEAEEDTRRSLVWYKMCSAIAAADFMKALEVGYARIRSAPRANPAVRGKTRSLRLDRFPFRIYYEASAEEILILRVFHLKRDQRTRFKKRR